MGELNILSSNPSLIILVIISLVWRFFWKGASLWRSARAADKKWFIVLLILIPINLFSIEDIVYLFFFAKKRLTIEELKTWFKRP